MTFFCQVERKTLINFSAAAEIPASYCSREETCHISLFVHCLHTKLHLLWRACAESYMELEAKGDPTDTTEHPHDDKRRLCDKWFTTKKHLSRLRTSHARENWYSCSKCKRRFLSPHALHSHRNIHTGVYKCTQCGRCCDSSAHLRVHRRSHSGEKPFECTVFGKRFTQLCHLVKHSRVHSGGKPFECTVCGKRFTKSGNLVEHSRVHSGEKPFECTVCGKRFTKSGNLVQHSRLHSGEKPFECTRSRRRRSEVTSAGQCLYARILQFQHTITNTNTNI